MQARNLQCDVLVAGGGAAGVAAAVGASRTGARVVLVEKYGFLGGMATAGMVSSICGLYLRSAAGELNPVSGGFAAEFAEKLAARQDTKPLILDNGLVILPYDPWHFTRLTDRYLNEGSIHPMLHARIVSVSAEGGSVAEVKCQSWNTCVTIRPACVVDCTGEAVIVEQAGGTTVVDQPQDASVIFRIGGLHLPSRGERLAMLRRIVHAADSGDVHDDCRNISFIPGHAGKTDCLLAVPIAMRKGNVDSVTGLEFHGRRIIEEVMGVLVAESYIGRDSIPEPAVQIGVRTGRQAMGRNLLALEHVLAGRKDEAGVARGCWPVEIWRSGRKPEVQYLPEGDWYDIPAGCLIAHGLDNMFMAGRCISADDKAMGSARVIGTALGTGYAAGTMAACRAAGRTQEDAVNLLRKQLGY